MTGIQLNLVFENDERHQWWDDLGFVDLYPSFEDYELFEPMTRHQCLLVYSYMDESVYTNNKVEKIHYLIWITILGLSKLKNGRKPVNDMIQNSFHWLHLSSCRSHKQWYANSTLSTGFPKFEVNHRKWSSLDRLLSSFAVFLDQKPSLI